MDVVIPYVDCEDVAWQDIFLDFKHLPRRTPKLRALSLLPFRRRFASYGLFPYWWRALEANYADITQVHLLLMQPSQYPAFLKPDDPRIVVHYHDEFMPKRILPCFDSSSIELCAIHNIPLSSTFILANDDMYFNQPCTDADFAQGDRPLTRIAYKDKYGTGLFQCALANGHRLVSQYFKRDCPCYAWHHLFQVYQDAFCKQFLSDNWAYIEKHLGQVRHPGDTNHMCLMMAQNLVGISLDSPAFPYTGYYECPRLRNIPYAELMQHKAICLNDVDTRGIDIARTYLEYRYPHKCSFEV